jgi:hypothetical protein
MLTHNDPYRVTRARISRDRFREIAFARFASPVLAERDPGDYYDAILLCKDEQGRFPDPLFVLMLLEHESSYGKAGAATETKSWGNTRPPSYGANEIGRLPQYINGTLNGWFSIYATWLDGCISTATRLVHAAAPYHGRERIIEIFEHPSGRVWAPAGDHNNPASYISAVMRGMNRDGDQIGDLPVGRIPKPAMRTDYRTPSKGGYSTPRVAEAISNHISDGASEAGDLSWLTKSGSGAGCNYYLNKAGVIYEMADWREAAWTNGPWGNPDMSNPLIAAWFNAKINPNTRTISKEFEGRPGDRLTPAQITASNHLDAWLSEQAGIPLDRTHYIGHYQIDNINRSYCPSFDPDEWQALLDGASAYGKPDDTLPNTRVFDVPGIGRVPVSAGFLRFYETFGGLDRDGWPLTGEIEEDGLTVQYFERSRFEWHPGAWPERFDTLRGRVGAELLEAKAEIARLKAEIDKLKAV